MNSIDKILKLLSKNIFDIKDKFNYENEYVECDISGTFKPIRQEMKEICKLKIANEKNEIRFININNCIKFSNYATIDFSRPTTRLYIDLFKRASNISYIKLKINGYGDFGIKITSENSKFRKIIHEDKIKLDKFNSLYKSTEIDLNSIKFNSSLFLSTKCLSKDGKINSFRWLGYVPKVEANLNQRIVIIRTYGNKTKLINNIKNIFLYKRCELENLLDKFIFIIYDSTQEDDHINVIEELKGIKFIYLKGKNFGGGGNASFLMWLVSKIEKEISEIILVDDDCIFDPEILIRHDGFITCRKRDYYSTCPVYNSDNPNIIQEHGAYWGQFFSLVNNKITTEINKNKTLFPYLVRNSRNINNEYDVKYISEYQPFEYSTYIFISFPFSLIKKKISMPFFLRNDDVELCLGLNKLGAKNIINQNLYVWHGKSHSILAEFYAIFHSLIVNNSYGEINKEYLYIFFLERVSKLAKVKNFLLLYVYYLILKNFVNYEQWIKYDLMFDNYQKVQTEIKKIQNSVLHILPYEVVDVKRNEISIIKLFETNPKSPDKEKIVFYDHLNNVYYNQIEYFDDISIQKLIEDVIKNLEILIDKFNEISHHWKEFIEKFNGDKFWKINLKLYQIKKFEYNFKINKKYINLIDRKLAEVKITENDKILPYDFDPLNYIKINNDVKELNINPIEHWLTIGKKENRQYK